MATTSVTQMALTKSSTFLGRLQYLLASQAGVVLVETGVGTTHAQRAAFAKLCVSNPPAAAIAASTYIAGSTNVVGTVVTNADPNLVDSSATDAAILSQVATSWNILAGIDTGN